VCRVQPGVDIVKYLLKCHGGAVSVSTRDGDLPVMVACQKRCSEEVIQELLLANPNGVTYMQQFYNS